MNQNVEITHPQEVREKVLAESLLLKQYAEDLSQEARSLSRLENLISDVSQIVVERKRRINIAIEHIRTYEDSPEKQEALRDYQNKLDNVENQARSLNNSRDTMLSICRDLMTVVKESTELSNTGSVLASKIQQLLDRIIEAI